MYWSKKKYGGLANRKYQGGGILPQIGTLQPGAIAAPGPSLGQAFNYGINAQGSVLANMVRAQQLQQLETAEAEARERSLLDLQGQFGMSVHNERQQKILSDIAAQHSITDRDMSAMDLDNPFQVKTVERSFSRAVGSQPFRQVQGEVALANKYREEAATSLSKREFLEWEKAWSEYTNDTTGKFDMTKLIPARYKGANMTGVTSFGPAITRTITRFEGADIEDPKVQQAVADLLALQISAINSDAGLSAGWLVESDDGTVTASPELLTTTLEAIAVSGASDGAKKGSLIASLTGNDKARVMVAAQLAGVDINDDAAVAEIARDVLAIDNKYGSKSAYAFAQQLTAAGIDPSGIQEDITSATSGNQGIKDMKKRNIIASNFEGFDHVTTLDDYNKIIALFSAFDPSLTQLPKETLERQGPVPLIEKMTVFFAELEEMAKEDDDLNLSPSTVRSWKESAINAAIRIAEGSAPSTGGVSPSAPASPAQPAAAPGVQAPVFDINN